MDTTAFFKLTYGLYIVTSKDGEHESGCVMNHDTSDCRTSTGLYYP